MCGICGFNWQDELLVKQIAKSIEHRGPDQSGFYTNPYVSLGHRRLKILDLSEKGINPMSNKKGDLQLIFNGEIYNYKPLRAELEKKGYKFKSETDTEVILYLYEEKGAKCVEYLEGMFAFAIWSDKTKTLFLATDHAGIKPIYYYFENGKFVFGSEIKCLLTCGISSKINLSSLTDMLENLHVHPGETLIENVKRLQGGNYLTYNAKEKTLTVNRYWKAKYAPSQYSEESALAMLDKVMQKSVESSLASDVPLSIALSGGIDSSLVASYALNVNPDIKTFTVGFGSEKDEFKTASVIAKALNSNHSEMMISFKDSSKYLPEIVWHLETPPTRTAVLPTFLFSKKVKERSTVVLLGEGGDELFAGYERHAVFENKNYEQAHNSLKETFFKNGYGKYFNVKGAKAHEINWQQYTTKDSINSALLYEFENQMPEVQLNRVDKLTMAASIEARVPFLNKTVIDAAFTVPGSLKAKQGQSKYILRKLAQTRGIPREVTQMPKVGLQAPLDEWFKQEFMQLVPAILSKENLQRTGIVTSEVQSALTKSKVLNKFIPEIEKLYSSSLTQKAKNYYLGRIWFTSMFVLWHQIFIENKGEKPKQSIF